MDSCDVIVVRRATRARSLRCATRTACIAALLGAVLRASTASAQTQSRVGVPDRHTGSVSITFQTITINERTVPEAFGGGFENFGEIYLRSAYLELDYGLSDKLAFTVSKDRIGNPKSLPRSRLGELDGHRQHEQSATGFA